MNEKTAKRLRKFAEIQGNSYRKVKYWYSKANAIQKKLLNMTITSVIEDDEKKKALKAA